MNKNELPVKYMSYEAESVVIGGGIAGVWTALKLIKLGVKTTLIYYSNHDRGGRLGATHLSAGAVNTASSNRYDYDVWLNKIGQNQAANFIGETILNHLPSELEELKFYTELKKIKIGHALASHNSKQLLNKLIDDFEARGGNLIQDGWVTKINASESHCYGIQFQRGRKMGVVHASSIVLAAGGYANLFAGSIKTGAYGSLHGRFLQSGGELSNTEFIFNHGYGLPDSGEIIPTENLPGVSIIDNEGNPVEWLEKELFEKNGTNNHLQALSLWNNQDNKTYYIDFSYQAFYKRLSSALLHSKQVSKHNVIHIEKSILEYCQTLTNQFDTLKQLLHKLFTFQNDLSYYNFRDIKKLLPYIKQQPKLRIRNIPYFSMGGVKHHRFKTNLHNTFVNGEMMHDFGANRVGGVPWALYLCAATLIANEIKQLKSDAKLTIIKTKVDNQVSHFNKATLEYIQTCLADLMRNGYLEEQIYKQIKNIRNQRKKLESENRSLDDCVSYLLLAESILMSCAHRKESRGSFIRSEFKNKSLEFKDPTLTYLNKKSNNICIK